MSAGSASVDFLASICPEEHILYVEDDPVLARTTVRVLAAESRVFTVCGDVGAGIIALDTKRFDVVMSDFELPDGFGSEVLSHAKKVQPECPRILVTSHTEWSTAALSVNEGEVFRVLSKPWIEDKLVRTIEEALSIKRMRDEHREMKAIMIRQQTEMASASGKLLMDRMSLEQQLSANTHFVIDALQAAIERSKSGEDLKDCIHRALSGQSFGKTAALSPERLDKLVASLRSIPVRQ
jgi:DNA-binding NtrC family response regulator